MGWSVSLVNIKNATKEATIYVGRFSNLHMFYFTSLSMHELHNLQLFYWLGIGAHKTTFCILPGFVQGQTIKQPTKTYYKRTLPFPSINYGATNSRSLSNLDSFKFLPLLAYFVWNLQVYTLKCSVNHITSLILTTISPVSRVDSVQWTPQPVVISCSTRVVWHS